MKAFFITPLYKYFLKFPNFQQVISDSLENTEVYPPLGLHYIASYTNKYSSHVVEVLDSTALNLNYAELKRIIKDRDPDVVGIPSITTQYRDCVETAKVTKKVNPDIHVCVGGPHSFVYPLEILACQYIDSVIQGEVERDFPNFLTCLENGRGFEDIHGLYVKRNGKIIRGKRRTVIKDLDALPFPDRKTMTLEDYRTTFGKRDLFTSIITTRGCPFRCAFCYHPYGQTYRSRSPENVVEELRECVDLGIRKLTFWADTFTINNKWVTEVCDKIIEERLDIVWECRGRVNVVNRDVLKKMLRAGCNRIHYGVESGVQRVLDVMKKDITLEQVRKAISTSKDIGFTTFTTWMIGLPTETLNDIDQTAKFVSSLKGLDFANFAAYFPLPDTEFYDMGMKQGLFNDYWRDYTLNPVDEFQLRAWDYDIPFEIIMAKLNACFRKFYMRPTKIMGILRTCETFSDFKTYTKAGLWLLRKKLKTFGGVEDSS